MPTENLQHTRINGWDDAYTVKGDYNGGQKKLY
jgi:hypothetical protein